MSQVEVARAKAMAKAEKQVEPPTPVKEQWEPWNKYAQQQNPLPLEAPPCSNCMFFHPVRVYGNHGEYRGVRLCHSPEMKFDFSCFVEKPNG